MFAGAFAAELRPNILFVFVDDSGWGDFSCCGSPVTNKLGQPITPPNLDKLAAQGIRFTQDCVASPICSPSRTGVLTGIEPARYSFFNDKASNAAHHMADWVQPDTVAAGTLKVNGTLTPPTIGTVSVSGGDFVFSATGGIEGGTYLRAGFYQPGGSHG
ncbi:MAG TPA: sulfatase-like hydrolase/transferase [Candidatus Sulfotelmatobacter sp.]|nr:sulfatase-like hydrolase/transferase [Candidatus Sulfotelmatobacter sp.]